MITKIGILVIITMALVGVFVLTKTKSSPQVASTNPTTPESSPNLITDYTASFAIFTKGIFRVFTSPKYHGLSQDVFIQKDNPNLVHVKKPQITWNDFFKTLPMELTKDCLTTGTKETFCTGENGTLKFYINGKKSDNFLQEKINAGDKALISFGNENDNQIQKQHQLIP